MPPFCAARAARKRHGSRPRVYAVPERTRRRERTRLRACAYARTGAHGLADAPTHGRTRARGAHGSAHTGRVRARHGHTGTGADAARASIRMGEGKAGIGHSPEAAHRPRESVRPGKTGLGLGETGLGLGKTGLGFFCARVRRFLPCGRIVARPRGEKPAEGKKTGKNGVSVSAARKRAGLHAFHASAQTCRACGGRRDGRTPRRRAENLARARAKNRLNVWLTRGLCLSLQYRKRLRRGPLLVPLHTVGARYAERLSYLNFLHAAHTAQKRKSYPKRIG